jgi:dihydrofolate synthase/folylpolyglutamate synthase
VQVLTGVGLEHTRRLGPTVRDIAEEKLAVVRDHATLVCGPLEPEARGVARRVARERHATLIDARPVAPGAFQRDNFAVAEAAAGAFLGRALDPTAVAGAREQTRVPGRLEVVACRPLVVHDGAHNPAGARALARALPEVIGAHRPVVLVISVLDDKDAAAMLAALVAVADAIVFSRCSNPRALSPATLEALSGQVEGGHAPRVETVVEPIAALARAAAIAGERGAVVATGSIYLIADLARAKAGVAAQSERSRL